MSMLFSLDFVGLEQFVQPCYLKLLGHLGQWEWSNFHKLKHHPECNGTCSVKWLIINIHYNRLNSITCRMFKSILQWVNLINIEPYSGSGNIAPVFVSCFFSELHNYMLTWQPNKEFPAPGFEWTAPSSGHSLDTITIFIFL